MPIFCMVYRGFLWLLSKNPWILRNLRSLHWLCPWTEHHYVIFFYILLPRLNVLAIKLIQHWVYWEFSKVSNVIVMAEIINENHKITNLGVLYFTCPYIHIRLKNCNSSFDILCETVGREKLIFKVKSDLTQIQNMKHSLSISSFCFSTPLFTLLALGHDSQKVALTLRRSSSANLIISLTKWVFFAVEHLTKVYCIIWYVFIHWSDK